MKQVNTYKQVLNQTLNNAWQLDAYIYDLPNAKNDSEG